MSTLSDYTNYQLVESELITKGLDTLLYDITKGIPWLAQIWSEIQPYLLKGNLYLIAEVPVEVPSSIEVTFEAESSPAKE